MLATGVLISWLAVEINSVCSRFSFNSPEISRKTTTAPEFCPPIEFTAKKIGATFPLGVLTKRSRVVKFVPV